MRKRYGTSFLMLPLLFSFGVSAGEIKGVVKDPKTNEPLDGVVVTAGGVTAFTEGGGRFKLEGLEPGTYEVIVDPAGAKIKSSATIAADGKAPDLSLAFAESEAQGETVTITGTRIPSTNQKAVSPVTSFGTKDVKASGSTRIEDVVNSLPQSFAAQTSGVSNGSDGTATVDLRGLGAARSLVLVNGRRLGPGNPNSFGAVVGDLNFIPSSLVDRVDVLTGGASAVYGADAVAGVVNFVMKKDFEGVQLDIDWGSYQHGQQNPANVQAALAARRETSADPTQFDVPANAWEVMGPSVSLTIGANSKDGKGNVTAYASYRKDNEVLQLNRDFSRCALNSDDAFSCGGSGTSSPARVGNFIVQGNTFRARKPASDVFNFGPLNHFQRPDERYNLGALAHYELAPWANVYSEAMYLNDRSVAQIAPGGIFVGPRTINCDNPFMTPTQAAQIGCTAGQIASGATKRLNVAKRNVEGGGRQSIFQHSSYRLVAGLNGDLGSNWNYDAYMQYMATDVSNSANNYFIDPRIDNALIVRLDEGKPQCQSFIDGTDTACRPYNIFEEGKVTPEALAYLQVPAYTGGYGSERVVNLNLGGDLGAYGIKSPMANEGLALSVGGEWRRQTVSFFADFPSSQGLLSGSGGANPPIDNSFDVLEAFGELRIPLAQDKRAAKNLALETAYRFSHYSFGKDTHTFKIGGEWEWYDDMRFRASYQRAVRAPALGDLYAPTVVALDGTIDPCAGLAANNPLVATCAAITWGGIFDPLNFPSRTFDANGIVAIESNNASQYNGQFEGNANLEPELSDTVSFGFVAQPTFLPALQLSIDYFNIRVDQAIGVKGADGTIQNCIASVSVANPSGDPQFCGLVQRDVDGSLFLTPQGFVRDQTLNTGSLRTDGVDLNVNYNQDLGGWGLLAFQMNSTWLHSLNFQPEQNGDVYNCSGLFGARCVSPSPEWRHKVRATWETPVDLDISAQVRYMSKVALDVASTQPAISAPGNIFATDLTLGARAYLDLLATYTLADTYTFRAGVNNVLDQDPPLVGGDNGGNAGRYNGNTYPGVYDALGRYIYLSGTAKW